LEASVVWKIQRDGGGNHRVDEVEGKDGPNPCQKVELAVVGAVRFLKKKDCFQEIFGAILEELPKTTYGPG